MTNKNEQSLELADNNTNTATNTRDWIESVSTSCALSNHNNKEEASKQSDNISYSYATQVKSGNFKPDKCFYPQTLNSSIHPIVKRFFEMDIDLIASRYVQLNPVVDIVKLKECLTYKPKYFKWAG